MGVTMFFALSGYLITGLIVAEVSQTGQMSYRRFYRNRALRLLPALYLLLAVFTVVEVSTGVLGDRHLVLATDLAGILYLSDLAAMPLSPSMNHLWTLAVEEQFYIVWPTLLIFAMRRRMTGWLLGAGIVGLLAIIPVTIVAASSTHQIYRLPTSWAATLLIGSAAKIYEPHLLGLARKIWPAAIVVLICLVFLRNPKENPYTYMAVAPLVAITTSALVLRTAAPATIWRIAEPLRLLGLISYGTYLWNSLVVGWVEASGHTSENLVQGSVSIALSVTAAVLSWWVVERHALALKARLDARARLHRAPEAAGVGSAQGVTGAAR